MAQPTKKDATSSGNVQNDVTLQALLEELKATREQNARQQEQIDILLKSVDHNAIRKNTPKEDRNPMFRVNMYDDKLVLRWDKMTSNKVISTPQGTIVDQTIKIYFPDDEKGFELKFEDFHTYRTQVEVEAISFEKKEGKTYYTFEYNGELYSICSTFIN